MIVDPFARKTILLLFFFAAGAISRERLVRHGVALTVMCRHEKKMVVIKCKTSVSLCFSTYLKENLSYQFPFESVYGE